jgi:hypothetical protein
LNQILSVFFVCSQSLKWLEPSPFGYGLAQTNISGFSMAQLMVENGCDGFLDLARRQLEGPPLAMNSECVHIGESRQGEIEWFVSNSIENSLLQMVHLEEEEREKIFAVGRTSVADGVVGCGVVRHTTNASGVALWGSEERFCSSFARCVEMERKARLGWFLDA